MHWASRFTSSFCSHEQGVRPLLATLMLAIGLCAWCAAAGVAASAPPPPTPLPDAVIHASEPAPAAGLDLTTAADKVPWVLVRITKKELFSVGYEYTETVSEVDLTQRDFRYDKRITVENWSACTNQFCQAEGEVTLYAGFPEVIYPDRDVDFGVVGDARWNVTGREPDPDYPQFNIDTMELHVWGIQNCFWPGRWCSPEFVAITRTIPINTSGQLSSPSMSCPVSSARFDAPDPNTLCDISAEVSSYYYEGTNTRMENRLTGLQLRLDGLYQQAFYRMTLTTDREELSPSPATPSQATLTATVTDVAGNPAAGERIRFRLDPTDLGRLLAQTAVTDAQGRAQVIYQAPAGADLRGRLEVTVYARNESHAATLPPEAVQTLRVVGNEVTVLLDPSELRPSWMRTTSRVTVVVKRGGAGVPSVPIELSLEPADVGSLDRTSGNTEPSGVFIATYTAPSPDELHAHDQVLIRAKETSTGAEGVAVLRFLGLRVASASPREGQKDVDLANTPDHILAILDFDKPLNPATVNTNTVQVNTKQHGNLSPQFQVEGNRLTIRAGQYPQRDPGLQVEVWLPPGEQGVKAQDGSLLLAAYRLRYQTMPELRPKVIISQSIDDPLPRGSELGRTLIAKPFVVRVEAGLPEESELDEETVDVTLRAIIRAGEERRNTQQIYYPGKWPPRVPEAEAAKGNAAIFTFSGEKYSLGNFEFVAVLHPAQAPAERYFTDSRKASIVSEVRPRSRMLVMPIVNDLITQRDWGGSLAALDGWLTGIEQGSGAYLPTNAVRLRSTRPIDTTCARDLLSPCEPAYPWTIFAYWLRQTGRGGWLTPYHAVVALVPPRWFDQYADEPDVRNGSVLYHDLLNLRSYLEPRLLSPGAFLIEQGVSRDLLLHAFGHTAGLRHSFSAWDPLAGYDFGGGRIIYSDGARTYGASVSFMNPLVAKQPGWITAADYDYLLQKWTESSSSGPRLAADIPLLGVSGAILKQGGTTQAQLDPLVRTTGEPDLAEEGSGAYAIELRDADGHRLARYRFDLTFGPTADGELANVLFSVPSHAAAASIVLLEGETALAQRTRSASAPTAAFTQPAAGGTYQGDIAVAWVGADADSDSLTYSLLYSGDGGVTWQPLLVDSSDTSYTLPSNEAPNGPQARLKVVASDGFQSGEAILSLALNNPLAVQAVYPADGAADVSPRTTVSVRLRDPLDEATVNSATFFLSDGQGQLVTGTLEYIPDNYTIVFRPGRELARLARYEARMTTNVRAPDGRALAQDYVWHFRVAPEQPVFLPLLLRNRASVWPTPAPTGTVTATRPTATRRPSGTPTRTATASPSMTPSATSSPTPTATWTVTAAQTATMSPSVTPSASGTATSTATATATASPSATSSPLPTLTLTATATATRTASPSPTTGNPAGISGRLTYRGAPAANLVLRLLLQHSDGEFALDATTTGADGAYRFAAPPGLGAGQEYYVQYHNTNSAPNPGPGYLYGWWGKEITSYSVGTTVPGGDFDLADVSLVSPADGAAVTLPAQFCWTRRGIAGDNYKVVLYDSASGTLAGTRYLGDVGCVTIGALPPDWPAGATYLWWVQVGQGTDPAAAPYNYGWSYYSRDVTVR